MFNVFKVDKEEKVKEHNEAVKVRLRGPKADPNLANKAKSKLYFIWIFGNIYQYFCLSICQFEIPK